MQKRTTRNLFSLYFCLSSNASTCATHRKEQVETEEVSVCYGSRVQKQGPLLVNCSRHTYFHPSTESQTLQCMFATVCKPVMSLRRSMSPTATLILHIRSKHKRDNGQPLPTLVPYSSAESATKQQRLLADLHIVDEVGAAMLALKVLGNDVVMVSQMGGAVSARPDLTAVGQVCLEQLPHRDSLRGGVTSSRKQTRTSASQATRRQRRQRHSSTATRVEELVASCAQRLQVEATSVALKLDSTQAHGRAHRAGCVLCM